MIIFYILPRFSKLD